MRMKTAALTITLLGCPALAGAVTIQDIIELSRAGVPDTILTALIDADQTVFSLDAELILQLQDAQVSERVVLKMLDTFGAAASAPATFGAPRLPVIHDAPHALPPSQAVMVLMPYPVVVSAAVPYRLAPLHVVNTPGNVNLGFPIRNGEFVGVGAGTRSTMSGPSFALSATTFGRPIESSAALPRQEPR